MKLLLLFILKSGQGVIYVPFGSVSLDEVPGNRRFWRFTSYPPIPGFEDGLLIFVKNGEISLVRSKNEGTGMSTPWMQAS